MELPIILLGGGFRHDACFTPKGPWFFNHTIEKGTLVFGNSKILGRFVCDIRVDGDSSTSTVTSDGKIFFCYP